MASSYANDHPELIEGLIMLGAYPVSPEEKPSIAIYGSEDLVLDKTKLTGVSNIHIIEGGNHAYFGSYGEQDGDGAALITREEQQQEAAEQMIQFIRETSSEASAGEEG